MKAQSARYECADGGSDQQQKRCDGKRLDCGAGTGHVRLLLGLGGLTRLIWLVWLFWLGDGFDGYRHLSAYAIMVGGAQLWARSPTRVCIYNIIHTIAHGGDGDVLAHGFEGFPLPNRLHCAIDLIVQRLQLVTIRHKAVVAMPFSCVPVKVSRSSALSCWSPFAGSNSTEVCLLEIARSPTWNIPSPVPSPLVPSGISQASQPSMAQDSTCRRTSRSTR